MASVTRQGQGSSVTFPLRPVSWNKGVESKQFPKRVQMGGRTNRLISLKFRPCLRLGARGKSLKISSFKGTSQNDEESGGRASGSMSFKKSAKISYVPEDNEATFIESPDLATSEDDEKIQGSRAIQKLFRNWLTLLRSPLPNQLVDETLDEPSTPEISETQNLTPISKRGEIARTVWRYFLALDSTVKIPLVIFLPLYMGVNVIYGGEVSKELTPMWVFGPLFVALQIQTVRWLFALYVYSFKQTIAYAKKLQTAYDYIACGKLKVDLWLPVVKIDYKAVLKNLAMWLTELNLDLMDMWPFYRRVYRELRYNKSNST